jgi:hypothetical protein
MLQIGRIDICAVSHAAENARDDSVRTADADVGALFRGSRQAAQPDLVERASGRHDLETRSENPGMDRVSAGSSGNRRAAHRDRSNKSKSDFLQRTLVGSRGLYRVVAVTSSRDQFTWTRRRDVHQRARPSGVANDCDTVTVYGPPNIRSHHQPLITFMDTGSLRFRNNPTRRMTSLSSQDSGATG